jgi:hypothetical protein
MAFPPIKVLLTAKRYSLLTSRRPYYPSDERSAFVLSQMSDINQKNYPNPKDEDPVVRHCAPQRSLDGTLHVSGPDPGKSYSAVGSSCAQ